MQNLLVKGRHLGYQRFDSKNITSDFSVHEDGVTLRLDDQEHLEWWLEVDIPKEVLQKLLKEIDDAEMQQV
jgi:hypothetical protein